MTEKREDAMAKKKTTKTAAKKKAAKTTTKKSTAKKKTAKKTTTAKKTDVQKKTSTKKTVATKNKASVTKEKVTIKELLTRQFEKPDNILVEPSPKKTTMDNLKDAPPFVDISDTQERDRIKALLLQKIDIKDIPQPKNVSEERKPKPVPKPKPVVPIPELLKKKFTPLNKQKVVPPPPSESSVIPDPPPFIEGKKDEVARIRELLFRKIDLTDIPDRPVDVPKVTEPEKVEHKIVETKSQVKNEKSNAEKISEDVSSEKVEPEQKTEKENIISEEISDESADKKESETKPDKKIADDKQPTAQKAEVNAKENEKPETENNISEEAALLEENTIDDSILNNESKESIMSNSMKLVFAGIAILFIMLYLASTKNNAKYYLIEGKTGVELWQGDFSPMGQSHILTLMGMELPEDNKPSYSKSEVNPVICAFFLDQANDLLSDDNIPNLVEVKEYLLLAHDYADESTQKEIKKRLNGIDFMMFVLKADLALQKGSNEDLKKAKSFINEAQELAEKNYQKDMLKKRVQLLNSITAAKAKAKKDTESKETTKKAESAEKKAEPNEKAKKAPEELPKQKANTEAKH